MPGARQNPQAGRRMYAGGFPGLTKEEAQHQPLRLFRGSPGPVSQACPGSRGTAPVDAAPGNRRHRSESVGPYPYRRPPARPVRGTVQRSSVDGVKNSASRGACPAQEEIHAPDSASGQPAEASRLPRLDAGAGRLDHRVRPRGGGPRGPGSGPVLIRAGSAHRRWTQWAKAVSVQPVDLPTAPTSGESCSCQQGTPPRRPETGKHHRGMQSGSGAPTPRQNRTTIMLRIRLAQAAAVTTLATTFLPAPAAALSVPTAGT